jgi:hypothetical protein
MQVESLHAELNAIRAEMASDVKSTKQIQDAIGLLSRKIADKTKELESLKLSMGDDENDNDGNVASSEFSLPGLPPPPAAILAVFGSTSMKELILNWVIISAFSLVIQWLTHAELAYAMATLCFAAWNKRLRERA